MPPVISVIMPVFNCREYLPEAVDSILQQTFTDFELICVDDGSDDGSLAYLKEIKDERVRIYNTERPQSGAGNARNVGIDLAQGKYLVWMDGDDVSMPNRLQLLFDAMERNPDVVMCGSAVRVFEEKYEIIHLNRHITHECILLVAGRLHTPTVIVRHDVIKDHHIRFTDFRRLQDVAFGYMVSRYGKVLTVPEILYHYRFYGYNYGRKSRPERQMGRQQCVSYMLKDFLRRDVTQKEVELHMHIMQPHNQRAKLSFAHILWLMYLCFKIRTWRGRYTLMGRWYYLIKYHLEELRG
jgi:glycosyltransferase involved in cell wall biosynthesis